ncbi:SDR family NAD(P)-dependent oxidoreductase [Scytonema sp. NUACC26]|uniref:SDR family NAD(P)-dependent oxidoreductase n=1 Tax=Scytonema sp. NUACC26 TaxID=3140176 RepID=UPI0034DBED35
MTAKATYQFAGKTILITGGAGDIGKATAHRFAANGAGVALLDLNESKMADVAEELKKYNIPVGTFRCNVTSADDVAKAFTGVMKQLGHIDYVFNNAGYQGMFAKTDEYPEDDFHACHRY